MNRVPTAVSGQGRACLRLLGAVLGPGKWRGGTGEPEKTREVSMEGDGKWVRRGKKGMRMDRERMNG